MNLLPSMAVLVFGGVMLAGCNPKDDQADPMTEEDQTIAPADPAAPADMPPAGEMPPPGETTPPDQPPPATTEPEPAPPPGN